MQEAIAAVDEATKKLPEIEVDLMATEGFGQAGAETEPPKLGSKVESLGEPIYASSWQFPVSCRRVNLEEVESTRTSIDILICLREQEQSGLHSGSVD